MVGCQWRVVESPVGLVVGIPGFDGDGEVCGGAGLVELEGGEEGEE